MNEYKIPCAWECYGYLRVEAASLQEAIEKAYKTTKLPDGEYVDASFEVDSELVHETYGKCAWCGEEVVKEEWDDPIRPKSAYWNFDIDAWVCCECRGE